MNKRNIYIFATLILAIALISTSYAYLKIARESTANANITLSSFNVNLLSDITTVTLNNIVPVTDEDGLQNDSITFSIKNQGDVDANYRISLIDGPKVSGKVYMDNSNIRYQIKRTVGSNPEENLGIKNLNDTGIIVEGLIRAGENNNGETISFDLKIWVDYNANPNGQSFSKKLLVEGMQVASIDTSGANFPELADNMIPVYYSATNDTEGVWKKADSKNLNTTYKWFDYNQLMWANAVTVKENGTHTRDYYLNADNGTTIEMDDITTMWVWIPRYKYVIFNGNNGTAEEQMINVVFEHGKESTGTVMCHDDIQTTNNSDHSEICTDTTNDSIINHKSTYTHPAFCFGPKNTDGTCNGEELTGFWMAKFEMSTDDNDCNTTPNDTNCNKTGLNILVKPNVYSLRYINNEKMFANIRRMETYGNIHGFEQNENATTWLNASSNLTGEIANDDNQIDTHMIKNMEWGAVSYLSQSKYGKQGNSLYTDDYKEVYVNNNSDYKTGYSGGSYKGAASNSLTYLYNNLTSNGEGQGYKGAGASTTGNVYGIYDMSGGGYESMMATHIYNSSYYSEIDSVWVGNNNPLEKYYDKYSYSNSLRTLNSRLRGKLGDATKEVSTNFSYDILANRWFSDYGLMPYTDHTIFIRGGGINSSTSAGIFASNEDSSKYSEYSKYSSRSVLTISRYMPWLENNNS